MLNNFRTILSCVTACFALFGNSTPTLAWGPDGHSTIGILAIDQLHQDARQQLEPIVNPLDEQAMTEACNWPDKMRETEEWAWSSRQHYINIPRSESTYLESRDCPDQQCATEAIKHYAAELANQDNSTQLRWQAFAWLCHFVGDLHQPLHAGFADDRGGNNFDIIVHDEQMNLHVFWDFELINRHAGSSQKLVKLLSTSPTIEAGSNWTAEMVNDWTNNSHKLAAQTVYPGDINIDEAYEQKSWQLAQQQLRLAATHLALIINTELISRD